MKKNLVRVIATGCLLCKHVFAASKSSFQKITVYTISSGASCTLSNDKHTWHIDKTPATITIERSQFTLHIVCRTKDDMNEVIVKSNRQMKYPTAVRLLLKKAHHDSHDHSPNSHHQHY